MPQVNEKTVLVIEDDRNTANLITLYLKREGFRPLTAGDGEGGLALAEKYHPDLVILDLMLPKLDGWEVCRRLRQHRKFRSSSSPPGQRRSTVWPDSRWGPMIMS